ncbi:MAG: hypothetical protein ACOY40_12080 [Bacillota bacterium]
MESVVKEGSEQLRGWINSLKAGTGLWPRRARRKRTRRAGWGAGRG